MRYPALRPYAPPAMHLLTTSIGYAAALLLLTARADAQPACPGDCDGNQTTSDAEFAQAVRAAFDAGGATCPAADLDGNGVVTAAELLRIWIAIVAPPAGCGVEATPTESASPTPTATPATPATPRSMWIPLTPLPGGPRQEIGVTALAGRVYVIGGLTDLGGVSRAVEVYDTAANRWESAADLPAPRHHIGAAALGGQVYAVAGYSDQAFSPVSNVYRYDPVADDWSPVDSLPTARGALAVAELGGKLYASGGSGPSGSVTDHAVYDPDANEWTELAPLPSPRNHLAAVGLDGYVFVIGGRSDGGGNANTGELDCYDPDTNTWDVLTPMPTARSGHAAAVFGSRIVVMGGEVNNDNPPTRVFVEVEMYDPATDEWTSLDPMAVPRHGIGAATVGDLIYVPGGATRAAFAATDYADALLLE